MIDLLVATRAAERITDYPSVVDLQEILALKHVQDNTRLWFAAPEQIVGFAFVDHYHNLHFEFDQLAAHPSIELDIADWGTACIRRAIQERGESLALDASCRNDDGERIALFGRNGFVMQEMHTLHMVRLLDEPIPRPQLAASFSMRNVAGEQEVESVVALHRAAFGSENMTNEERLAMMRLPDYDSELDLLAITQYGKFAAYCLCSIRQEENRHSGRDEGYIDTVATHPDFQRRGLARALLLTGLHRLKQRGVTIAMLGTSSENLAMRRSAQAVGFRPHSTTLWFSKLVT